MATAIQKIDIKSLIIGLLIGMNVILLTGATSQDTEPANIDTQEICQRGTYQVACTDNGMAFIIDTRNSHLWSRTDDRIQDMGTVTDPGITVKRIDKEVY